MGTKLAHKLGLTPPRPTAQEVFWIALQILRGNLANYESHKLNWPKEYPMKVVLADPQEPKVQGDELTR